MTNRKLFLLLFTLTCSLSVFSQHRKVNQLPKFDKGEVHWGFYLGWNNSDYRIDYKKSDFVNSHVTLDSKTGFNIGITADTRLSEHFNLRFEPGLISNQSTLYFWDDETPENSPLGSNTSAEIEATYLHIPVLIKYSAIRLNNVKPYLIGGFSYDYNFSSNQDNGDDNFAGEFRMQTHNFMYEIGFGFDIYFHYFKFSPSLRGQFALTNQIQYDDPDNGPSPWTDPIENMGARSLFIKLAFE